MAIPSTHRRISVVLPRETVKDLELIRLVLNEPRSELLEQILGPGVRQLADAIRRSLPANTLDLDAALRADPARARAFARDLRAVLSKSIKPAQRAQSSLTEAIRRAR